MPRRTRRKRTTTGEVGARFFKGTYLELRTDHNAQLEVAYIIRGDIYSTGQPGVCSGVNADERGAARMSRHLTLCARACTTRPSYGCLPFFRGRRKRKGRPFAERGHVPQGCGHGPRARASSPRGAAVVRRARRRAAGRCYKTRGPFGLRETSTPPPLSLPPFQF